MAMNKSILTKLSQKTTDRPEMQEFLAEIIQFESNPKNGWYEKAYSELLEKYCPGEEDS